MDSVVFDQRFHDLMGDTDLVQVGTDWGFTEGPVMMPGGYLVFSDVAGDRIIRFSRPDRGGIFRQPSGGANGNTLDLQGRLITCEAGLRRVTRTEPDGTITVLADRYQGKPLNAPNDVVVRSDGSVYFTDPVFLGQYEKLVRPSYMALDFCGVFRITPSGEIHLVTDEVPLPNGLAFSADESVLYVVNSSDNTVLAFDVNADGGVENKRVWLDMARDEPGVGDGMKIDVQGNAYVAGPGGIWVAGADGTALGIIRTPVVATNLAFYGFDSGMLFVTAPPNVYLTRLKVPGISVIDRVL